ncbi:MAG: hypothetical protein R2735_08980 [Microthrixaceae bacterium]
MTKNIPLVKQRRFWTVIVGLFALASTVVAIGVGARAWILADINSGIVAHAAAFGEGASVWIITAAVLLLTTVVMGVGTSVVRHLASPGDDAGVTPALPVKETLPTKETLEPKEQIPEAEPVVDTQKDSVLDDNLSDG